MICASAVTTQHHLSLPMTAAATGPDGPEHPPPRRAAFEQTDWQTLEKDRFADALAAKMNAWAHKKQLPPTVLIAAPRTLGELRTHLSDGARGRLLAEISADLAHQTVEAIEKAVAKA